MSNNPPPLARLTLEIDELYELARGTLTGDPVATDDQETAIDALADEFRKLRKEADTERAAEKKPHDDAGKAVQAAWKPSIERCDRAIDSCREALTPYRQAKQAKKDADAKALREQAEKQKQEALQAFKNTDAVDLDAREEAERILDDANRLAATAAKIDRSAKGLRTYWEAEITDPRAALNFYVKRDRQAFIDLIQSLADKDARSTRAPVDGVIFHERKKAI